MKELLGFSYISCVFLFRVYTLVIVFSTKGYKMLTPNNRSVLNALACICAPSGYKPSVGEVARVAGVARGVADRSLQKLAKMGYCKCYLQTKGRVNFRFGITLVGRENNHYAKFGV